MRAHVRGELALIRTEPTDVAAVGNLDIHTRSHVKHEKTAVQVLVLLPKHKEMD